MKEKVTKITTGEVSIEFHTKAGILEVFNVPFEQLMYIHLKIEHCAECRTFLDKNDERLGIFDIVAKLGLNAQVKRIDIVRVPERSVFAAICQLTTGETIVTTPSAGLGIALVTSTLGVEFNVYIEADDIASQTAKRKEIEEKFRTQVVNPLVRVLFGGDEPQVAA